MPSSNEYAGVFQRYHETESKLDQFVAGSTLAILAFSIQSTQHANAMSMSWLLVSAWASFLLSFIAGLCRMEVALLFRKRDIARVQYAGEEPPDWKKSGEQLNKKTKWAYRLQKYLLVLGLFAYAVFHVINFCKAQ